MTAFAYLQTLVYLCRKYDKKGLTDDRGRSTRSSRYMVRAYSYCVYHLYFVTVFSVGDRLTSLQSVCASGLYFFAATSAILAQIGYMQAQFTLLRETPNALDGIFLVMSGEFWTPYMALMEFTGVFFSL